MYMLEKFLADSKAQVSAELLIVLAAVLAVAVVLVSSLQDIATGADKTVSSNAAKATREIKGIKPK